MWEVPHSTGQRPLDSRGNLRLWVRGHLALHFTDPAVHEGPQERTCQDMASQPSAVGSGGAPVCPFPPHPGLHLAVGTHGGQRAEKMSLLGYLSPLTRKPKRRHLSQQKGHPAHWLIPGAGDTAGSPLCPPPSGRGWCPVPTVVALGDVLTVCSASVSPSGKWGQGY